MTARGHGPENRTTPELTDSEQLRCHGVPNIAVTVTAAARFSAKDNVNLVSPRKLWRCVAAASLAAAHFRLQQA
jgi:hypothetical protein